MLYYRYCVRYSTYAPRLETQTHCAVVWRYSSEEPTRYFMFYGRGGRIIVYENGKHNREAGYNAADTTAVSCTWYVVSYRVQQQDTDRMPVVSRILKTTPVVSYKDKQFGSTAQRTVRFEALVNLVIMSYHIYVS